MTTENNSAPVREIPVPPGGGSWTFDHDSWTWVSNDPVPATADAVAIGAPSNTTVEQEP